MANQQEEPSSKSDWMPPLTTIHTNPQPHDLAHHTKSLFLGFVVPNKGNDPQFRANNFAKIITTLVYKSRTEKKLVNISNQMKSF